MESPKIYRISDASKFLGISKRTIFRYEKSGVFPFAKRNVINGWREYTDGDLNNLKGIMGR